jgi:hypothetical protein
MQRKPRRSGGHAPAYEANRRRRDGCAELVRRRRDRAGEARSGDTVAAAALEAMAGIGGGLWRWGAGVAVGLAAVGGVDADVEEIEK